MHKRGSLVFPWALVAMFAAFASCGESSEARPAPSRDLRVKGAVIAHIHNFSHGYGTGVTGELYPRLKKMGYNAVQFNTFAYQPAAKLPYLFDNDPTMSRKRVIAEIRAARAAGLEVMLKPHVWLGRSANPTVWRSHIDYKDPDKVAKWFKSYRKFMTDQVRIAIAGEAEYFVVGTELVSLTKYESHWRDLIRHVRALGYKGKLSYACEAWNAFNIKFWDALDIIGLDFYYGTNDKKSTAADLQKVIEEKLRAHLKHAHKLKRSLHLTEVGFPSHGEAFAKPWSWPRGEVRARPDMQTKAYGAFRRALLKAGKPDGIWIWKYVTKPHRYERRGAIKGFIMQGKPAEREIEKILRK